MNDKVIALLVCRLIIDSGIWAIKKHSRQTSGLETFQAKDIESGNTCDFALKAHGDGKYHFYILNGSGNNVGRDMHVFDPDFDDSWAWFLKCDESMRDDVTNVWSDL